MPKVVIFLLIALAVALAACSGGQDSQNLSKETRVQSAEATSGDAVFASPAAAPEAPAFAVELQVEKAIARGARGDGGPGGIEGTGQSLQTADRKVISTASISMEVEAIEPAIKQVQAVVEGMGGFVENLSSSGGSNSGEQFASMTLRVPQDRFMAAVEAIENLGVVQNRTLGSEDVSERFIDLKARLKSSLREEQSLLSLLERTRTVSEILTIERELSRVRADVERFQGQLNFLERRVDLATINLTMVPPRGSGGEPPSAILGIEVSTVGQEVDNIKGLVASMGGSVDRVFLSLRDGRERADISLRVFTKDFSRTVDFLDQSGDVKTKEITEGKTGTDENAGPELRLDATIQVSFMSKEGGFGVGRIAIIVASAGGVILALVIVFLAFTAVRDGRFGRGRGGGRFR